MNGKEISIDMKIGFAGDHAGFLLAAPIKDFLERRDIEMVNYGTFGPDSVDYPDFAHRLGEAIDKGEVDIAIAACGTGNGMAMCLNKHAAVRAGIAWNREIAKLCKEHNDANVLVLSQRFVSVEENLACVREWLDAEFVGGRHARRVAKIPYVPQK